MNNRHARSLNEPCKFSLSSKQAHNVVDMLCLFTVVAGRGERLLVSFVVDLFRA